MHWRVQDVAQRFGPFILFGATVAAVAALLYSPVGPGRTTLGFAQALTLRVASLNPGVIARLSVRPGEQVQAGQIVATLDPSRLDQEIAILEADIGRLRAQGQVDSAQALRQTLMDEHSLSEEVQNLHLTLARERDALAAAQLEVEALGASTQRLERLRREQLATEDELAEVRLRLERARRTVAEAPGFIALIEAQLTGAEARAQRHQRLEKAQGADPSEGEILAAERQLLLLQGLREDLALRAPASGRVTTVHRYPGEVVAAGEPVLSLVRTEVSEVLVCLNESKALTVDLGRRASLIATGRAEEVILEGEVVAMGPMMDELPAECRAFASLPARGRQATVHLLESADLLPGQRFNVRFWEVSEDGAVQAAEGLAPTPAPQPRTLRVPPALQALTRMEPSGLLWRAERGDYLVVSDDTGLGDDDEHRPWIFSLDPQGRFSPKPIPVRGVGELNDLEAIAAGPAGGILLLSSQSHSKQGKRSPARTALLEIQDSPQGFEVRRALHLAPLLDGASPELRDRLGIPEGTGGLDIEGMVYGEGALYLGLKAPLAASGRAMIWRVGNLDALFEGDVDGAQLSLHAEVPLDAEIDGESVPGGISDLFVDATGALLLTSTPATGDKGLPTGRLWRASAGALETGGILSVEQRQSWVGFKPEGLAAGPEGRGLVILFDTGAAPPRWAQLP